MPRGKLLSSEEKASIDAYKDMGCSNRTIAKKINRSRTVIDNYINLGKNYGKNHPTGGNKKMTKRQHSLLLRSTAKELKSAAQLRTDLTLPVTTRRVQQILKSSGRFKWTKMLQKPALKVNHKEARLKFAQKYMSWTKEWERVIFSDEKKFNLGGPDGYKYYWHDLRNEKNIAMSRNFGGGSLMIWAAFRADAKTPICRITTRMNSTKYTELLEMVLIPFIKEIEDDTFIFQHDNAAVHASNHTKQWLNDKNITVLTWPACSPDLNPIENLWGILARKVYGNCKQYNSVCDLWKALNESWASIEVETLQTLISSMPNRIYDVIRNNGKHTKY